jgi:hypothetical protein
MRACVFAFMLGFGASAEEERKLSTRVAAQHKHEKNQPAGD